MNLADMKPETRSRIPRLYPVERGMASWQEADKCIGSQASSAPVDR
jgi:hypothetical protein